MRLRKTLGLLALLIASVFVTALAGSAYAVSWSMPGSGSGIDAPAYYPPSNAKSFPEQNPDRGFPENTGNYGYGSQAGQRSQANTGNYGEYGNYGYQSSPYSRQYDQGYNQGYSQQSPSQFAPGSSSSNY